MLPRTDIAGTRPLAQVDAAQAITSVVDNRQALLSRLAQIGIGKTLMADVLSRISEGTYLLKIADTAVKVNLPVDSRVGDQIALKLVATEPRPTFLFNATAAPDTSSAPAALSPAARLIGAILQTAQDNGTPVAIIGKTPIVATPLTTTPQLAAALQNTLALSGVFYESHVQQWAEGELPLVQLMREPQAQAPAASATDAGPTSGDGGPGDAGNVNETAALAAKTAKPAKSAESARPDMSRMIDIVTEWGRDGRSPAAGSGTDDTPHDLSRQGNPSSPVAATAPERIDAESAQRINLQLQTLETNRVAWQGELWPGQKLEWEVSEDAPKSTATPNEQSSWTSTVRFELPTLGVITANIYLDGDHVRMQVRAPTENTALRLRQNGHDLVTALDAAGSPLDLLTVKTDDQT